jgi:dTDP-4-dehydrorhamnose reductase
MDRAPDADVTHVVGATSVLGWALVRSDRRRPGWSVRPCCNRHNRHPRTRGWSRFNTEDAEAWQAFFETHAVRRLIYAAGICDVDRCEADPAFAWTVNVRGVECMLKALPDHVRLVHCSSDHVFGGRTRPYLEADPPHPISVYGRTRVQAEAIVRSHRPDALIVRVGLPIGPSLDGRTGHLDWLRHRHARGLPMTLVADERRSAVWADAAAERIHDLAESSIEGIRHISTMHALSRPQLARRLCASLGIAPTFTLTTRAELCVPHLGNVELASSFTDTLARPLASIRPEDPPLPRLHGNQDGARSTR